MFANKCHIIKYISSIVFISLANSASVFANEIIYPMDFKPPEIQFTPPKVDQLDRNEPIVIEANVKDDRRVDHVYLYYRESESGQYAQLSMEREPNSDLYKIALPLSSGRMFVQYYIEASDWTGTIAYQGTRNGPYSIGKAKANQPPIINAKKWMWVAGGIVAAAWLLRPSPTTTSTTATINISADLPTPQ